MKNPTNVNEINGFLKKMASNFVHLKDTVSLEILCKYNIAVSQGNLEQMKVMETQYGEEALASPFKDGYQYCKYLFFTELYTYMPLCVAAREGNLEIVSHLLSHMPPEQRQNQIRSTALMLLSGGGSEWIEQPIHHYFPLKEAAHANHPMMLAYLIRHLPEEEHTTMAAVLRDRIPAISDTQEKDKETLSHALKLSGKLTDARETLAVYSRLMCTAKNIFSITPCNQIPLELWNKIIWGEKPGVPSKEESVAAIQKVNVEHPTACHAEKRMLWAHYIEKNQPPSLDQRPAKYKRVKGEGGTYTFIPVEKENERERT